MSERDREAGRTADVALQLAAELATVQASADLTRIVAETREARLLALVGDLRAELAAARARHARHPPEMPATPGRRDAADQRIARLLLLAEGQRRLVAALRAAGRGSQLATALLRELERSLELLRSCRRLLG